MLICLYRSHFF
ncbi:hypothetical protein MTR67_031087 [Solanum verrucosum]|uniref:Uncharacterized protein n=1 Tax=Solanum verrucosum TaxID=315347 RepID=A0AAF0U1T3_SOLVR|nr:hypothetical protein MTR67_031087 [Solanum verrucosum]